VITADGLCGINREQRIILWNDAAQQLLGYAPREVQGRCCFEVLGGLNEDGVRFCKQGCPVFTRGLSGQASLSHDIRTRTKSGQDVWLAVTTVLPSPDVNSEVVLTHLFRDITHSKLLQLGVRAFVEHDVSADPDPLHNKSAIIMAPSTAPLTPREREILRFLAAGASTREIAESLMVSSTTVRHHVGSVLTKLHAHTRLEAVSIAHRQRLLECAT